MKPALLKMLTLMKEAEDREEWEEAEAVADGIEVWVGDVRFHWHTLNHGIYLLVLRDVSDVKGAKRYTINEVGKLLLRAPDQEVNVHKALYEGGAWTVKGDEFVKMDMPEFEKSFG